MTTILFTAPRRKETAKERGERAAEEARVYLNADTGYYEMAGLVQLLSMYIPSGHNHVHQLVQNVRDRAGKAHSEAQMLAYAQSRRNE